jgi:hypothetical protein
MITGLMIGIERLAIASSMPGCAAAFASVEDGVFKY